MEADLKCYVLERRLFTLTHEQDSRVPPGEVWQACPVHRPGCPMIRDETVELGRFSSWQEAIAHADTLMPEDGGGIVSFTVYCPRCEGG